MHTTKPILEAIFELFFSLLRCSLFGAFFKVRSWKESIIRQLCFDAPCLELSLKAKLEGIHYQTALFRCSLFRAFSKFIPLLHSIYSTGFDAPSLELSLNKVVRLFSLCIGIACFDAPLLELSLNHTKLAILSNLFAVSTLLNWSFRKMHTTKPILEAIFELFFSLLRYSLFGSFFK